MTTRTRQMMLAGYCLNIKNLFFLLWETMCRCLMLCLIVITVCPMTQALEPPRPGEIEELRRTGQLAERLEFAKQLKNHEFAPSLVSRAKQKLGLLPPPPRTAIAAAF